MTSLLLKEIFFLKNFLSLSGSPNFFLDSFFFSAGDKSSSIGSNVISTVSTAELFLPFAAGFFNGSSGSSSGISGVGIGSFMIFAGVSFFGFFVFFAGFNFFTVEGFAVFLAGVSFSSASFFTGAFFRLGSTLSSVAGFTPSPASLTVISFPFLGRVASCGVVSVSTS